MIGLYVLLVLISVAMMFGSNMAMIYLNIQGPCAKKYEVTGWSVIGLGAAAIAFAMFSITTEIISTFNVF